VPLAFTLTGGEKSDSRQFATLLDLGPDIQPRAVVADKGYDANANRALARQRGICPAIPFKSNAKKQTRLLSQTPLSRAVPHRADLRQAEALQAGRIPLREDSTELRRFRLTRSRLHHYQIRPHSLVS